LITGDKTTALTRGDWQVNSVASVDEKNGWVYFTGWLKDPTERHLYRVNLDGRNAANPKQISKRPGWHGVTVSKNSQHYFDSYSNVNQPTQVSLHQADGKLVTYLLENRLDENHPLTSHRDNWIDPTFGTITAEEGTELHFTYIKPTTPKPGNGYPAIVYVYGGPLVGQQVRNAWSGTNLWAQYMANRGYVIFKLDNRGTYNRGKAFEDVLYKKFGEIELQDQITGVNWLKKQPWVDGSRIGIYGFSYGGYMTLMAMFRAAGTFVAGVAGAPVTDYRSYDTHYTERYLSTPQKNPNGYDASAVFPYTEGLKGDLLLYHGMADDNVLFVNTTKLIKQLQDQGKVFEFMAYPGSKHSFNNKALLHRAKTIDHFFDRTIGKEH
jgi:dipeptidyl-peptidase-4